MLLLYSKAAASSLIFVGTFAIYSVESKGLPHTAPQMLRCHDCLTSTALLSVLLCYAIVLATALAMEKLCFWIICTYVLPIVLNAKSQ